jgi:hypothetical protein
MNVLPDDEKTVESIRMWQQLMQDIHPVVEKELIKLALVLFLDAKSCRIDIKLPEYVNIYMQPYTGFKYYYYKYIRQYNKSHEEWAKKLLKAVYFWMPCDRNGHRPKIQLFWE